MESKLILVEGIPGAGKTTIANKIKKDLDSKHRKVNLYEEGMSHPADMAWQAYLSEEEYANFLGICDLYWKGSGKKITKEELHNRIKIQTRHEGNHVILAYTRINFPESGFWSLIGDVASREICDGRTEFSKFKQIHLDRWTKFGKEAEKKDEINIFECAFLQNHIFELRGVYQKTDREIVEYLSELLDTIKSLNPKLIYIKPSSVENIISQAAEERKAPDKSRRDWIDEISEWVKNTNYGKCHNLSGKSGVLAFCEERLRIDQVVISNLDIPVEYINRD